MPKDLAAGNMVPATRIDRLARSTFDVFAVVKASCYRHPRKACPRESDHVDARVEPAHDDRRLSPVETQQLTPVLRTALRFSGNHSEQLTFRDSFPVRR
jgi:hypothetical protein